MKTQLHTSRIVRSVLLLLLFAPFATAQQAPVEHAGLLVRTVRAQMEPGRQVVSLTGEIAARDTLDASFPAAGRVARMFVREGDSVTAGQILATTESVSQEQALRSRQAAAVAAQADLDLARTEFDRQDALLERGATTRAARDSAEDALRSAEATMAEAQAARDLARKDLDDTVLSAPRAALVTRRAAEVGQVVGAAETVIVLALGTEYDAVIAVPEGLLSVAREAPPVHLSLLDVSAPPFEGKVREVSPLVDPDTGTVRVKIAAIDPPDAISIGETVRGTVSFAEPSVVALPFSALSATAEGPAVWVVDPETGTVSLRQVGVLRHETDSVLIDAGLADGEMVVAAGGQLLFEGARVRLAGADDADGEAGE